MNHESLIQTLMSHLIMNWTLMQDMQMIQEMMQNMHPEYCSLWKTAVGNRSTTGSL